MYCRGIDPNPFYKEDIPGYCYGNCSACPEKCELGCYMDSDKDATGDT